MVLWELLTCEIPYRDVDNSAIIYGVGSSSLHLPIPSTCPDGFRLIVQMCWNSKPRNRPSFKYILMHLDIAAVEIRSTPPETYFKTQVKGKCSLCLRKFLKGIKRKYVMFNLGLFACVLYSAFYYKYHGKSIVRLMMMLYVCTLDYIQGCCTTLSLLR